jgi:Flp pilus assembly protein TadB
MKLSDPFGRLEARHQKGYETMRASLLRAGIETPEAARDVVRQAWRRGLTILAAVLLLLLVLMGLLPKAMPLSLALGLFLLVWVASSTISGQRYVKRYIEEELKEQI